MSYRIDVRASLAKEVRRVAVEELDAAIDLLQNPDREGVEASVHSVRKSTKRLRSLLRLVQPALGEHHRVANATIRDASGMLSSLRDAQALLATFDVLVRTQHEHLPPSGLTRVRTALAARAELAQSEAFEAAHLRDAADLLSTVRDDVPDWSLPKDLQLALDGATTSYDRARMAYLRTVKKPSGPRMHEWRKRVKDGWYHTQLLRDLAPRALEPQQRWLADLSDALGDNNDLTVLADLIAAAPSDFGKQQAQQTLVIIADVQHELIDRCHRSGARLYAESPRAHGTRLQAYASASVRFGREKRLGGLDTVYASQP